MMLRRMSLFKNTELKYVHSVLKNKLITNYLTEINPVNAANITSEIYYQEKNNKVHSVVLDQNHHRIYSHIGKKRLDVHDAEALQFIFMLKTKDIFWVLLVLLGGLTAMISGGLFVSGENQNAAKASVGISVGFFISAICVLCYNECKKENLIQTITLSKEDIASYLSHKAEQEIKNLSSKALDNLISTCLFTIVTQTKAKAIMHTYLNHQQTTRSQDEAQRNPGLIP